MKEPYGIMAVAYKFGPAWDGLWTETTEALWWESETLWDLRW